MDRRRFLATALPLAALASSGCIGSFALTKKVYDWNKNMGSPIVSEIIFLVLVFIVPVYSITLFIDGVLREIAAQSPGFALTTPSEVCTPPSTRPSTFTPQRSSTPAASARATKARCKNRRRTPRPGPLGKSPSASRSPSR